jgi:ParB/RepB/Spo0J family partition protein
MKLHNVPLDQIVWNPWRDKKLFPIDADHVAGLRASIKEHGFFSSVKGRRRGGKVELGCGHARFEAAKRAGEETMPIFIDDIDDDQMLALMTDENALQYGSNAGAIMNEVAAATRRIIEGVLESSDNCPKIIARLFDGARGLENARGTLRKGNNPQRALGPDVIHAYLGDHRGERAIREAIAALKQSGVYAEIVDEELSKHPEPVADKPAAKTTAVARAERPAPIPRLLDERTASVFENDYQFHTFRQAVTTPAGRKMIPVKEQLPLAKEIMESKPEGGQRKRITAGQIQRRVQHEIQTALKQQRDIDKEERERYLAEQRDAAIKDQLLHANGALRAMLSAIARLIDLAEKNPNHPELGGFSAKLDTLVAAIQQFSKKLK